MSDNDCLRRCQEGFTLHPLPFSRYLHNVSIHLTLVLYTSPSFTQTFMQLCLGLPEDLQKELFPTLLTPTKRSSSPIIYLESFPLVTSSEQLCHEFKRIFDYLPDSSKLIFFSTFVDILLFNIFEHSKITFFGTLLNQDSYY